MTFDDAIQIATLASVAIALVLSLLQNRQVLRQTREMTKQSSILVETIEYSSYQATVTGDVSLSNLAAESPELLRWHLAARGYPVRSNAANRKALFAIVRLNAHEEIFLHIMPVALMTTYGYPGLAYWKLIWQLPNTGQYGPMRATSSRRHL